MTGFVVFVGYLLALLAIGFTSQRLMRGTGADFFTASASIGRTLRATTFRCHLGEPEGGRHAVLFIA